MAKEFRYFQFPLCLLLETYKDRVRGLNLMSSYGIVHFAKSQNCNERDAARQLVYDYYRNRDKMPEGLFDALELAEREGRFTWDDDYNGFNSDGQFTAEENTDEVMKIMEAQADFKTGTIQNYQLHQTAEFLHIDIGSIGNTLKRYNEARAIQGAYEARFGPDAMTSVKPSILFDFRDNPKQDIDLFRAYLGIISMIGYRNFISTNKPAMLSRMIGAKSKAAFIQLSKNKEVQTVLKKYSKRYNMDKLLLTLAEQKFIMFLSKKQTSVIYVSRYMEPKELAELVKQSRNRNDLKKKMKDATASL
jgi:hypothetical protein